MTVKSRLLELLEQHKGETLSGEALAGELHCTRAAVWKAVKSLREEGYAIEAGPNKGYMLPRDSNRLSVEAIRLYLKRPDVYLKLYKETGSTNQMAKQAAISGEAGHGAFVIAQQQTAGRGRRGRSFYSPEDAGLYLSVVLEPKGETLQESLLLTTAAATAVYKAVKKVCRISLDIKWVNDLYFHGQKVCGILTEAVTDFESGNIEFAVVGIGLNLYPVSGGYPEALQGIAGALYPDQASASGTDRNYLTAEIVNCLLEETSHLRLSPEYVEHNIIPGKEIEIMDGSRNCHARALDICPDGRLRVEEEDGTISVLSFGEVSVSVKQ
ncbi:MAG: biotin--[acetyl-CoA-carboxylase] ligase [Blautia sp.]|nr:biotin--[acetyl-CoA-carboxylase] ligase [Blautia sp.]MDY3998002.1 biotin--[acetyl-CoA-carboxylase] ligase [Blautia sp.]